MIARRPAQKIMIPIASMGDIAFLLIIFFVLTSTFMKQKNIELEKPASPDVEQVDKGVVNVALDKNGNLWVDGEEMQPNGLAGELALIREQNPGRAVHVTIDRALPKDDFVPVMEALSTESPGRIVFLGDQTEE